MEIKKNKKGFTLVELVIVIAVIAILMAVLIPTFASVIGSAQKSAAEQEGRNLQIAIMADSKADFNAYCDRYKTDDEDDNTDVTVTAADFVIGNEDFSDYVKDLDNDEITITFANGDEGASVSYYTNNYHVVITASDVTVD